MACFLAVAVFCTAYSPVGLMAFAAEAIDITPYIQNATLSYRTDSNTDWVDITNTTIEIPGDAELQLNISYAEVNIDTLLNAGCQMYYTLPNILRNPQQTGDITAGEVSVGTTKVNGDIITLTFNETWLNSQRKDDTSTIKGDFNVTSTINLTEAAKPEPYRIAVGSVDIEVVFVKDIIAQYGEVKIEKSEPTLSEEADGDYFEYTITATAGEDGLPNVKVVDTFTQNSELIDSYVGVTGTSTTTDAITGVTEVIPADSTYGSVYIGNTPTEEGTIPEAAGESLETTPGTMVWNIGDMKPNESRTLTYKVKLKDNYIGRYSDSSITNTAEIYSGEYKRTEDTSTFTPTVKAEVTKQPSEFKPNENGDGGGTITYTICVKADENNSYTVDKVEIVDSLQDGSFGNYTDINYLSYLCYDETSFKLYNGGKKNQNGTDGLTHSGSITPTMTYTYNKNNNKDEKSGFICYVESLAPGESKTITYDIKVDAGIFTAARNNATYIKNQVKIYIDGQQEVSRPPQGFYHNATQYIGQKVWDRKLVGENTTQEIITVTMPSTDSFYDNTTTTLQQETTPSASFTVPVGSYKYQVVANEAGDWDLSSATMNDSFNPKYLQYVGYVQLNAYTINSNDTNQPTTNMTDEQVVENLNNRTPDKTVWIKVDENTSFKFKPSELGLDGNYAYLMTYYAKPVNTDQIVSQADVKNSFSISDDVSIGESEPYTISGNIGVSRTVTIQGEKNYTASKESWYYEETPSDDFPKGAIYWVIKLDGNIIPKDLQITDEPYIDPSHYGSHSIV